MVRDVPHLVAKFLHKEDVKKFSFHGFRRSSATAAADAGASVAQLMDSFAWKNPSMAQVRFYISFQELLSFHISELKNN